MTNGQIFRGTLIVLATLAGAVVLLYSVRMLIIVLMAILIASALRPTIVRLSNIKMGKGRFPYGLAILLTYGTVLISILFLMVLVLPPVLNQFATYLERDELLASQLIRAQSWVERNAANITGSTVTLAEPDQIRSSVTSLAAGIRRTMPDVLTGLGGIIGESILVFVMGVYWLTSRDKAVDFVVSLITRRNRETTIEAINEIETSMGNYIRGVVLVALFVGVMNTIILSLLGVPNSITLGFIVGITTMLPVVGGFIGGIGATLLAGLANPLYGALTFVTFVGVQQVETHYLTPRVMSRSVGIDPILIIVGIFIGFSLYGVMGAILSIPILGALNVLLRRFVIEPRQNTVVAKEYKTDHGAVLLDTGETPAVPSESALIKPTA
jgi:predicted PurR-regulated permease PerM